MSLLSAVEHNEVELELGHDDLDLDLDLLIEEARRRQRSRRLSLAVAALVLLGGAGAASSVFAGGQASPADKGSAQPLAAGAGTRCRASSASFVANGVFSATVLGKGPVRLGVGNVYEKKQRKIVVGTPTARGWAGIEAIWWLPAPGVRGPITVRGVALAKQGPIEVQLSDGGQAPGAGPLTLPDASALALYYPGRAYPGSIWVRSGGCYALDISGRGFSERIVFDALTRSAAG